MKLLVTCPPMIGVLPELANDFKKKGWDVTAPPTKQTLTEDELARVVPGFDAWIAGDDPVSQRVLAAGKAGRLRAVVKWGIGVDNVDFTAAKSLGFEVRNTPAMFGEEVADLALHYVIGLARQTFAIDRGVRSGGWPKPRGMSLRGKVAYVVGFGNIGRETVRRLNAVGMEVLVHDPMYQPQASIPATRMVWPTGIEKADVLVLTCPLTPETRHMVNAQTLARAKKGLRVVNVARGPIIDEPALTQALERGQVHSVALDVFEEEPLPMSSPLRSMDQCVFGSHNASNTFEGSLRASHLALRHIEELLAGVKGQ